MRLTKPKIGMPASWMAATAAFTFVGCTGVKTKASGAPASASWISADCCCGSSGVAGT